VERVVVVLAMLLAAAFLLGFITHDILNFFLITHPGDWVKSEHYTKLTSSEFCFSYSNLTYGRVAGTRSMVPSIYKGVMVIYTTNFTKEDLQVGDIIAVRKKPDILEMLNYPLYMLVGIDMKSVEESKGYIHRIIYIGEDSEGWFAITKGDNTILPDLKKVRFEDIDGVVIGVVY